MEDITLKKYYELANRELGIQKSYNEDENIYYLIAAIEKLIDINSGTIKVNGNDIDIETYKTVLNNKIMLQQEFNNINVYEDPKECIKFVIAIVTAIISSNLISEFKLAILIRFSIFFISIIAFYFFIGKTRFKVDNDCVNYISFYKLVLDILNKKGSK